MNRFSFAFKPGFDPVEIVARENTGFIVTFVYAAEAPGFGALCSESDADGFHLTRGTNAMEWGVFPASSKQTPSWLLRAPAGKPILGTRNLNTVEFVFENVRTDFDPGPTIITIAPLNMLDDKEVMLEGIFSLEIFKGNDS